MHTTAPLMAQFSPECTIFRPNIKHYKRSGRDSRTQMRLVFHRPLQTVASVPDKRKLNYTYWRGGWGVWGAFCTMIHEGEPLWLFQHFSEAGLCFILPDGQLNERSLLSFSIFPILLTPRLLFSPSIFRSISLPPKTIYLYLLWHSEGLSSIDVMRNISDQWLQD